jgi:ribosome-associated heat shock protein Hsp15
MLESPRRAPSGRSQTTLMHDEPLMDGVRIDKWLWAARFFKTRGLATEAVVGGRVRLNGERVKPAKDVRADDVVEVRIGELRWTVAVRGVAEKRGSARVAATLYLETAESIAERERAVAERKLSHPPGADLGGPRPTKQDRRRIDELRRGRNPNR